MDVATCRLPAPAVATSVSVPRYLRRANAAPAGPRSRRVLLQQGADGWQRRLDVFARAAAHGPVRLDNRAALGPLRQVVGHPEHRLRHLLAPLDEVVPKLPAPGRLKVRPEGLEPL